ncbi:hypothetical protein CEXT_524711 [Caerostris extrusa]|uniref:Uncharacterized protein n=1 Tax=Caerostris extrusa TaxID=172846 RepID=A0AAV4SBA0_CAEEX|nr:hypothetical protein CEXT_524711 [Caerostris extrusa]
MLGHYALYNQTDMKAPFSQLETLIIDPYPRTTTDIIFGIVKRATQKMNVLRIPEKLKTDLIFVLKSTVILICKWFMENSHILKSDFVDVSSFQWRSEGTIDRKTAQAFVRREATMCRVFATSYCLEEDVLRLQRRCSLRMLSIRVELCHLISTDWMGDWCKYTGKHNCRSFGSQVIASVVQ